MNVIAAHARFDALIADVGAAVRGPETDPRLVAEAMAAHCGDPTLLAGRDLPCGEDRYVRHKLHEDVEGGWAIAALIWRPGQMSPVHSHHTWCALGVHRGTLTEHFFAPGAIPRPKAAHLRAEGDTSHGPGCPDLIHRIANCCAETAVSIHVYGVPYAEFADGVNRILA